MAPPEGILFYKKKFTKLINIRINYNSVRGLKGQNNNEEEEEEYSD